ncbi:MAG: hypothetical protein EZS28_043160, partial [Streblomastix strix]
VNNEQAPEIRVDNQREEIGVVTSQRNTLPRLNLEHRRNDSEDASRQTDKTYVLNTPPYPTDQESTIYSIQNIEQFANEDGMQFFNQSLQSYQSFSGGT